ncbi:MAG TPA: putative lipid II flippase FtsW [Thermoanaerobaculia bacterium]|nr:putative lipid II flippase FtsW [Thermoanaerobaculia bacterium]
MAKKLAFDKVLFTTVVLLLIFGLVMVYSASAAVARDKGVTFNPFLVKQAAAAVLGLVAMVVAMHFDYRRLRRGWVIYGLLGGVLALLVAVLFQPELNGTRRWFHFGGLSLQPSELAKLAFIPFLAWQLERKADRVNAPELLLPVGAFTGLTAGLILLEPDLGTAVLLCVTTFLLLFLAGLSWRYVLGGIAVALPVLYVAVVAVPYRRQRLFAFLDPEADPYGAGFQALQSLIAVGSGGVFGLGPGASHQKLYFLPHPHSDFVYAIVAEELGMIGALVLVALFAVLAWRGAVAAWRAPDLFGRYLAWGFTGILVTQALINISVAIAILPTKGIPLPFISYGGSSLLVTMTICGVLLNLSQHG